MSTRRATLAFLVAVSLTAGISFAASGASADAVTVLVGDEPGECLSLESLFIDGDGYVLIDGRNNRGRVKFVGAEGTVLGAVMSTVPLPDAASLPPDILPSPWGLDRVAVSTDSLWAVPAAWSGAIAERFDRRTGSFIERIPDPGLRTGGLTVGPQGDIWAVGRRILVNLSGGNPDMLNLGGALQHIDSAVGHPLGFVILAEPDLLFVEPSGVIRWRMPMDGIVDGYVSPYDIATGPDGTIAVCGVVCDLSDPENRNEYFRLRNESLARDDEDVLFATEDALRSNLGVSFVLLLVRADGTVTDAIEIDSSPVACAVDAHGRAHVLLQHQTGWSISILDPRLDEGIKVCDILYGTPAIVAPHRLTSGPDGSLYWDDVIPGQAAESWGIERLLPSTSAGMFSLSGSEGGIRRVISEPVGDFVRLTSALAVLPDDRIFTAYRDYPFDILNDPDLYTDQDTNSAPPFTSSIALIDASGGILRRDETEAVVGGTSYPAEMLAQGENVVAAWAGPSEGVPVGILSQDGLWSPAEGLGVAGPLIDARLGRTSSGLIGWFLQPGMDLADVRWLTMDTDLAWSDDIERLGALRCRFLESDPDTDSLWLTIDDGEIMQFDLATQRVTGIWENRLPSGAPGHMVDDAAAIRGGLAVLDREHRAIILVGPEGFAPPPLAAESEVSEALSVLRAALQEWKNTNGDWPVPSPGLLDEILLPDDRLRVQRAFIGGRIYQYRPSQTGYTFTAWSATSDQPALMCTASTVDTVY